MNIQHYKIMYNTYYYHITIMTKKYFANHGEEMLVNRSITKEIILLLYCIQLMQKK